MAAAYETSAIYTAVTFAEAGETESIASVGAGSGANRVLLVAIFWYYKGNDISAVRYNTVGMTDSSGGRIGALGSGNEWSGRLYRLVNPASGANTLAIDVGNTGGQGDSIAMVMVSVDNTVDQTTPVDGLQTVGANGSTVNAVTNIPAITSAVGDRVHVFHGIINDNGEDLTATPTNYTERQDAFVALAGTAGEFGDADGAASVDTQAAWSGAPARR